MLIEIPRSLSRLADRIDGGITPPQSVPPANHRRRLFWASEQYASKTQAAEFNSIQEPPICAEFALRGSEDITSAHVISTAVDMA